MQKTQHGNFRLSVCIFNLFTSTRLFINKLSFLSHFNFNAIYQITLASICLRANRHENELAVGHERAGENIICSSPAKRLRDENDETSLHDSRTLELAEINSQQLIKFHVFFFVSLSGHHQQYVTKILSQSVGSKLNMLKGYLGLAANETRLALQPPVMRTRLIAWKRRDDKLLDDNERVFVCMNFSLNASLLCKYFIDYRCAGPKGSEGRRRKKISHPSWKEVKEYCCNNFNYPFFLLLFFHDQLD